MLFHGPFATADLTADQFQLNAGSVQEAAVQ